MTAATDTGSVLTTEEQFIEELRNLGSGDRARLRRSAGTRLGESGDAMRVFYRALPYAVPGYAHEHYYLVATLFPLADENNDRNFGETLRRARDPANASGLDRRFSVLLDADERQMPFRLRQMIRLAHSRRIGVNWSQLLRDLQWWTHRERRVQKSWAMSYYSRRNDDGASRDTDSANEN